MLPSSVLGMRDLGERGGGSAASATMPSRAEIEAFAARLAGSCEGLDDAERIDRIRALEQLKCAAAGAQAELTADFDASQRAAAAAAGVPAARQGRGIALQIAFARRESHRKGEQHVGLARVLRDEMRHTSAVTARPRPGPIHTIETITPTGHRYTSRAPTTGPPVRTEIYRLVTLVA